MRLPKGLARGVTDHLLPWYAAHARDLPWRRRRTPYRVWVSELMLQQTRVDQAAPYFRRFLRKFPSLKALAEAPLEDVLKQWAGLGYYARARNLHRAARDIRTRLGGRFPRTVEGWMELPGVGEYTARAIASLAYGVDAAVVDGNVVRVLSRWTADDRPSQSTAARRHWQHLADRLLPAGQSGAYNEALMELGATVCLPRQPRCDSCPMRTSCRTRLRKLDPHAFPVKTKRAPVPVVRVGAAAVRRADGTILLARRPEEGFLGGLWEFPGGKVEVGESTAECARRELLEELGIHVQPEELLIRVKHAYSHFKLDMDVYWARWEAGTPRTIECSDFAWVRPEALTDYALSRADQLVAEAIQAPA